MKQENLDELRNIYLGLVTGGEGPEVLNEAPNATAAGGGEAAISALIRQGISPGQARTKINYAGAGELKRQSSASATNKSLQSGQSVSVNTSAGSGLIGRLGVNPQQGKLNSKGELEVKGTNSNFAQDKTIRLGGKGYNRLTAADGSVKYVPGKASTPLKVQPKPVDLKSSESPVDAGSSGNGSSGNGFSGNGSGGPTRPAASGPVLSKLKGVEGTGVGANFKAKAFTDTEKTRYSSVAAAKPAIPTGTTAGGTTFQRRAATGDELRAAQDARAAAKAAGDTKGAEEAAVKAGVNASKPSTPTPNPVKANVPGFALGGKPTPTPTPAAEPSGETDRLKKALDIKKSDVTSSYQWPSIKTVRDIADAYTDIYEKHNDGNLANNYPPYNKVTRGDVIAGATGNDEMGGNDKMGRKKKKKPSNKKRMNPYLKAINSDFEMWIDGLLNEGYDLSNYTWNEVYEIYENAIVLTEEEYGIYSLVLEHLLSNGYAETEHDANIIIENMSDKWVDVIIDEAYKGGPEFGMKYSKSKPLSGEKGDGSGYGPPEKFTKPDDKIEKPGTTVPPFKKGGYGRIMSNIPHGIGPHRDKTASRITTITGKDPGAPTSQKMRAPDKKRLSREIVRKKPQA